MLGGEHLLKMSALTVWDQQCVKDSEQKDASMLQTQTLSLKTKMLNVKKVFLAPPPKISGFVLDGRTEGEEGVKKFLS